MILFTTFCFYLFIPSFESARILGAFSFASVSHQVVFRALMKELARRGHEIVMITPIPSPDDEENPQTLQEIDVGNVSFTIWKKSSFDTEKCQSITEFVYFGVNFINEIAEKQLETVEIQNILKSESFDLIFYESCARTILGASLPYEVPVIEISSMGGYYDTFDQFGAIENPILHPSFSGRRLYNRSSLEIIHEWYNYYISKFIYKQLEEQDNERLKRIFGPQIPDINQLRTRIQLLLLNVHPLWDSNRAVPSNVLYLENISEKAEKPLPEELKSILDSSINGVIYMSFGGTLDTSAISNTKIKIFINVFSKLPFDFLIKWNGENLSDLPPNIKLFRWFPQADLLRHPKVKLFITQGGLQSTDEAITAGVPLICLPLLGDQWQNAERYEHYKIGIHLPLTSLTEKKLMDAINSIISNNSYRENVIRLRQVMRDRPKSSLERAVLWTEYVLRNGFSSPLAAPAANMPWTVYYELEIVSYLLGILLVFIVISIYLTRIIIASSVSKLISAKKRYNEWYFNKYISVIKNK